MIGIDFVEIDRVKLDQRFWNKIAYAEEIEYIKNNQNKEVQLQKVASLWAVKEAVMKALELGQDSGVVFKDIKLCHEKSGKPYVELYGVAKEQFGKLFKNKKIEISLSHSKTCAVAIAIVV